MARNDPYRNFRFRLDINGITQAGFSEATGFHSTVDVIEYREGNDPVHVRKLPGLTKYGNITLKWGITDSTDLYKWYEDITKGTIKRTMVTIVLLDETGKDKARWTFKEAWPSKYDAPNFNAKGNDTAIETLEIVFEEMIREA